MIRIARASSAHLPNIEFQIADVMSYDLPPETFDCITSLATLHHLPLREIFLKLKAALKPGGLLLILDLFEPIKWHGHPARDSEKRSDHDSERHFHPDRDSEEHGHSARDSRAGSARHTQTASIREGLFDTLLNFLAIPVSVSLRLIHHGRLLPRREARAAWAEHEEHDLYPTMTEVRTLCSDILPRATIRRHLLCRYSGVGWK